MTPMHDTLAGTDHNWQRGLRYQALTIALDGHDLDGLMAALDQATDEQLAPLVARELERQLGPLAVRIAHQLCVTTIAPALQEPRITPDDAFTTIRYLHTVLGRLLDLDPTQEPA